MSLAGMPAQRLAETNLEVDSLDLFVAQLLLEPAREPVASELGALQSIYGGDAIKLWRDTKSASPSQETETIRYEATLSLPDPYDAISFTVLVSLPSTYPSSAPPQLQLLSRYIGHFGVDPSLFGMILRTFISSEGVEWTAESVCVFDGLEWVKERCTEWYEARKSEQIAGELMREDEKSSGLGTEPQGEGKTKRISELGEDLERSLPALPPPMPEGIEIITAEPITDRKSSFVGRACHISDPAQVPLVLQHLMSDRRISRAAHPIIHAWRCQVGNTLHQDNDDDGETAAGGRLAHLLQILEVHNVLVVVTRYWGGIHLGPDRFKHINQSARNALDLGGFLDTPDAAAGSKKHTSRGKKR